MSYFSVGVGGFLGAVARYYLSNMVAFPESGFFPIGTVLVNLLGCFFLGFFLAVALTFPRCLTYTVTGVATGFTGSFTTFSTFNLDALHLFFAGKISMAVGYVFISLLSGIMLVWIGNWLGEALFNFIGLNDNQQILEEKH
ncbi:fluoride efflux transporter CrcB [Desulfofundulus thermocisternus]|uniref:fluoride efflux transporter CrcB n=1 Tax=Desulfofundulus thermocisternus TaxID=42471 RepID=UPI00217F0EB3|nr:fluoride efflux transporter CrcB [Desulfofundulus thermocisternus]MCS5696974.1 fluoride efflux transporter CrcB [Desulfofundulus thermocisternus]